MTSGRAMNSGKRPTRRLSSTYLGFQIQGSGSSLTTFFAIAKNLAASFLNNLLIRPQSLLLRQKPPINASHPE
jgi:hypothetical protein